MMIGRFFPLLLFFPVSSFAQGPEFTRGFTLYSVTSQGINARFDRSPDYWIGTVGLHPAYGMVPGHLRAGMTLEWAYTMKKGSWLAGPRMDFRVADFPLMNLGTAGNFHVGVEHLFGTGAQRLVGIISAIELFKMLSFDLRVHRDYHNERWWIRAGVGYNFLRKKRSSATGTDPLDPR